MSNVVSGLDSVECKCPLSEQNRVRMTRDMAAVHRVLTLNDTCQEGEMPGKLDLSMTQISLRQQGQLHSKGTCSLFFHRKHHFTSYEGQIFLLVQGTHNIHCPSFSSLNDAVT